MTVIGLCGAAGGLVPASASASSVVWVAQTTTVPGNGSGCTRPGYNAIQTALENAAPKAKINVCSGTYEEQLEITQPVGISAAGAVTVKLPSPPRESKTACDQASGEPEPQDLVSICEAGTVKISGLTLDGAWPEGTCNGFLNGILVADGSDLKLTDSVIDAAGAVPLNGCQGGIGVFLGLSPDNPNEAGTATLTNDRISGYQKGGVLVFGLGSKATIKGTTVTGDGPTPYIAQNGIEVLYGGAAKISRSTINGNECDDTEGECGPSLVSEYQATGVLFLGAANGSSISSSTIDENDVGALYESLSANEPLSSQVSITGNTFTSNRDASVLLSQGFATVNTDKMEGGHVGIGVIQADWQSYGAHGTGKHDTIKGMSQWAILGASDKEPGDPPGSFTITQSKISGNPGGVTGSVFSESSTLNIFTAPSDS